MSYAEAAEYYDLIYSVFKDYDAESARLATIVRQRLPGATDVLDVGYGFVGINAAESEQVKVCRMARTTVHGRLSRIEFHYLFGRSSGIEHRREIHELGLFTSAEMLEAFSEAGLEAQHDPEGLIGRGLYIATR